MVHKCARSMQVLSLLINIFACYQDALGQPCEKCSLDIVSTIDRNIDSLSAKNIGALLCTFSKECSSNIEFSEYSNQMLFQVLEKYPRTLIAGLKAKHLELNFIYAVLSDPVSYENIAELIEVVRKTPGNNKTKQNVIAALEIALRRSQ